MKRILFLSANDFKERSIQVIRKTPEAYAAHKWDVDYLVIRDTSRFGSYFYEKVINPPGVNITRLEIPLKCLINYAPNIILRKICIKLAGYLTIFNLFISAVYMIKKKKYDIIYGYEVHGVWALFLLKLIGFTKNAITVSRFQGTFFMNYYQHKNYLKMIKAWDMILALKISANICIMTNDGTQGDKALEILKSPNLKNYHFWINGVDKQLLSETEVAKIKDELNINKDDFIIVTISRLVGEYSG